MSIGGSKSKQSSTSTPQSMVQSDLLPLRYNLSSAFNDMVGGLLPQAQEGANIVSSQFQNLFGQNPTEDFMGARGAVTQALGGDLGPYISQAYQSQAPAMQQAMEAAQRATLNQAGPLGMRFGTDAMGLASERANELANQALARSLQAGLQSQQTQLGGGLDVMRMISELNQGGLGQLLPFITQYATQFAPVGQRSKSSSRSGSFNFASPEGGYTGLFK